MIGKVIGNYEITSELAHGGMGAVYRGRHLHLPREVVVKSILLGAFSPSAQDHLRARFRREAFVQSQLDHLIIRTSSASTNSSPPRRITIW
jgi:serine/threonine protein kinase